MPRVPAVDRAALDEAGQAAWDEIAASRPAVHGPFAVLLHSPELARRTAHLGEVVRYGAALPDRHRHLVVMVTARELDCQYEFAVHADLARRHGVPEEVAGAIARGEAPRGLTGIEAHLVAFARQLVIDHRVDGVTFAAVQAAIGLPGVTEVVGTIGYFSMIATVLNAFEVEVRREHRVELAVPNPSRVRPRAQALSGRVQGSPGLLGRR